MPVSFPPPAPPQQASVENLRQRGTEIASAQAGTLRVHLLGADVIGDSTFSRIATGAAAGDRLVARIAYALGLAYRDAGYPAARITYASDDADAYLLATLGPISSVEAPPPLLPYFRGVAGMEAPQEAAIEKPRRLAELHAERIGLDVASRFVPDPDPQAATGAQVLQLQVLEEDPDRTHFGASVGNPGNRFVGRYFSSLSVSHDWTSGDELGLQWTHGLSDLEDNGKADHYEDLRLSWSRITTLGVFGASAHITDYEIDARTERPGLSVAGLDLGLLRNRGLGSVDGSIREAELEWLYPLRATRRYRWTINSRLDYSEQKTTARNIDDAAITDLQDQTVGGVEIGTGYSLTLLDVSVPLAVDTQLNLRKGFGDDGRDTQLASADPSYWLLKPRLNATFDLSKNWSALISASGQVATTTLPQRDQWVLGGAEFLYAYSPGVIVGDSGSLFGAKLIYQGLPELFGVGFKLYGLSEYGIGRFDADGPNPQAGQRQSVADIGGMIRAQFKPLLQASLSFARGFGAHGIDQETLNRTKADFYFRVELKF